MYRILTILVIFLVITSCTTKPRVSGYYHGGASSSGSSGSGSLLFSQPF